MAQILKSRNLAPSKVHMVQNPGNASIVNSAASERPSAQSIMSTLRKPTQLNELTSIKPAGRKRPTNY